MKNLSFVALTGHPGTGKTTVGEYISRAYDYTLFEGSSFIREQAELEGVVLDSRQDYIDFHIRKQRENRDNKFSWLTAGALALGADKVVHVGVRERQNMHDIKSIGGLVIALVAPPEVCFNRMDSSLEKTPKTIEEYYEMMQADISGGAIGTDTQYCIDNADVMIRTDINHLTATLDYVDRAIMYHA